MGLLDQIEQEDRRRVRLRVAERVDRPYVRAFLTGLMITPVLLCEAVFIPIFGQLLVALAIGISLSYLWARRSVRLFAAGIGGAVIAIVLTIMIGGAFGNELRGPFAYLLAGSTFATLSYIAFISMALVGLFEKAPST